MQFNTIRAVYTYHSIPFMQFSHSYGSITSWFKHKPPNFVSHECRMQYQLECHTFGMLLTAMNSGRGWHSLFLWLRTYQVGLALAPKMCLDQSQAFKEVNNNQTFTVVLSGRAASRCFKACLYKVSRKYSKNCVGPVLSKIKRPKLNIH